jgi:EmrB/QacA subfamily drug resistance transporter
MERKWWTLLVVCTATFMLLLDITIVNVALPDIQKDLNASLSDLQWVVDAYALTLASLLLTAGSLADLLGRKRVFAIGLVLFSIASLLCGLSTDPTQLNLARALQGIGGAIMFATSLALIAQEFEGRERGTALGAWGATIGFAVAVGPLVGGALTEGLGWEWIFFVNVPIGALALALTMTQVRESRNEHASGIDWGGVVTFSASLFCLVYALIQGNEKGWSSGEIVSLLIASVLLMAAFLVIEWRSKSPMFDISLFRKPTFTGANLVAFTLSASMFAMFLYLTLYMQNILDFSPLQTGWRFLPLSLLSFVVAPIAGQLSARLPVRGFVGAGLLLVSVALLLMHGVEPDSKWTTLLPGFIIAGIGIGMVNPALASTAIGVVPPQRSGMASGINNTFRQVGIATGIAGLGAIFQHRVEQKVIEMLAGTPAASQSHELAHGIAVGGGGAAISQVPANIRPEVAQAARDSFISGFNDILLVGSGIALIGAIGAVLLIRQSDFVGAPGAAESAEATAAVHA